LSVEQALADYAAIANGIRESQKGAANCPIIAFGGSYGGMLAAWIRLKYPNVFQGLPRIRRFIVCVWCLTRS